MFWPRERVYIFGILPMEAWVLVAVMTVMALFGGFTSSRGGIAHFAHLGGFLGAFGYLKYLERASPARRFKKRAASVPRQSGENERANLERWSRIPQESMHEVNRAEVDRLLEKVRTHGASSLTPSERECLDRFSPD
jgi:hypothetical protein